MSTAIKIEGVSKLYRLGTVGTGTISHDLNRWWHSVRGKEDPYAKVGQVNDRTKKAGESTVVSQQSSDAENCKLPTDNSSPNRELKTENSRASGPDYVWALKDINLEVAQGEILGIIGRNGAGKSTLLKLLSRVTAPTAGSIKARGRITSLLEVGTGFHPELTGRENVYLNGSILGMKRHEISKELDEIVHFSGCAKYMDTPVKRFSSGMKVRLGFAVAAHLQCEILIVDEVLAVGDVEFQKQCLRKMEDVSGSGRTVVFVSHNMESIRRLCGKVALIAGGKLDGVFETKDAIKHYLEQNIVKVRKDGIPEAEVSKGISLVSCDVFGDDGSEVATGGNLTISLQLDVLERIPSASVQIKILTETGTALHRDASHFGLRTELELQPGLVQAVCEFSDLPLAAGTYNISVAVVKPAQGYYLRIDNCITLAVFPRDIFKCGRPPHQPHSLVSMNGKWTVDSMPSL